MNCCKMYIALVVIIINFWSFHSAEGLSSIDWINESIDILSDSTNNLVITTIPNAVCDAMSKTVSRDCHEHDATKLAKWFFSVTCVANCNDNIGLPSSVIQKVEVECVFSKNNTSNMTMSQIGWSAECLCPNGSIHGGKRLSAEETSFGEMLVEFSRLQCDHGNGLADAASKMFKYSKRGIQNCLQTPSICDLHAICIDSVCICNEGYTGNGEDCFYLCKIPIIERTLKITDTSGNILLHDDYVIETETVIVTCDQLDRPKVNLTCGCDGFDKSTVCLKAIYLAGGKDTDITENTIVFYPESPKKSYISSEVLVPRSFHSSYLTSNNELYLFYGESSADIEMLQVERKQWTTINDTISNNYYSSLFNVGQYVYVCGGDALAESCMAYNLANGDWKESFKMGVSHYGASSFVLENKGYIIAGSTDKVERLDPTAGSSGWQSVKPYPFSIYFSAATSYQGYGYVCGGFDSVKYEVINKCFIYNPAEDNWSSIASMNVPRNNFGLIQHDGVLYALFGQSGSYKVINNVEMYNISGDNAWRLLVDTDFSSFGRYGFSIL